MNIRRQRTDFGRPEMLLARFISALLFVVVGIPAGHSGSAASVAAASTAAPPKAFVALHDESAVAVLDTSTNRVLRTIPVPLGPHGLAMTPDGSKVFFASSRALDGSNAANTNGTLNIWVVNADASGVTPLTKLTAVGARSFFPNEP